VRRQRDGQAPALRHDLVVDSLAHGFVFTSAIRLVAVAAFEAEAKNPVNEFEQVEMFLRLAHQPPDQQIDFGAALAILVE
jgi:hypothetical protein